ncbi:MAG: hypothetical protein HFI31_08535 [Lachnospiraceae bacterium]|jgi:uncharacterized membrane protein|nr:hypothetical protein [Lachnospiraceae bacterium]MCI8997018.1 hypothetical protein [Lachnospiraceae bacterium]MCI9134219.1 hypothetical protein [Lachnospiraceae bacterium]
MEQQPYYYTGPTASRTNAFALASLISGILSLITCLIIYLTVFFGCLSIIFALLSRQEALKMPGSAQAGCVLSTVAMILSAVLTAISFVYLIYLFGWETVQNPEELLRQYSEYMKTLGGMTP